MSEEHLSNLSYSSLPLHPSVMQGVVDAGFTWCTPIQAQTLPAALTGRDIAGQAQTGTGKTAAFLVALYQSLLEKRAAPGKAITSVRALVVAPTRELAVQIHKDALVLGRHTGLSLAVVFGGVDYDKQRRQLADGVEVLIGTPGRIIDYLKQGIYDLRHAQVLVLDEADRMFDLGFIADIRYIMRRLPPPDRRQSMLFSATLSHRVMELAYEHMNNPELIRIEPDKMTVDSVKQVLYFPSTEEKIPLLMGLLRRIDARRTMGFVTTKRVAEVLERTLTANGFVAQAISGDVPQNKRLKMMRDFHEGEIAVLIATDVASRGLHIPDVSHVFNFDLPNDAEDYVHRIGRTARAGAEGDAISFGCEEYAISLPDIERYIGHQIPRAAIEASDLAEVTAPPPAVWRERAPRPGQSRSGGRPGGGGGRSGGPGRSGNPNRTGGSRGGGRSGGGGSSGGSGSSGSGSGSGGRSGTGGGGGGGGRSGNAAGTASGGDSSAAAGPPRRRRRNRGGGGPAGGA